ncbi:MAG: hypothetical protein ACREPM_13550 [Gemmatimonadaceae bacterium]
MILVHREAWRSAMLVQASLLPIAPILLLPFILIFFVIAVPIWGVSLAVVGLVLAIMLGFRGLARLAGVHALDEPTAAVHRAFRWVLTWGGFTERGKRRDETTAQP